MSSAAFDTAPTWPTVTADVATTGTVTVSIHGEAHTVYGDNANWDAVRELIRMRVAAPLERPVTLVLNTAGGEVHHQVVDPSIKPVNGSAPLLSPSPLPSCTVPPQLRPTTPQTGITPPPRDRQLIRQVVAERALVWWCGTHGGAGESSLARYLLNSRPAEHAWPISEPPAQVVLVARSHHHGLMAARYALTEWAAGTVPVDLLGLVIVADAPRRLPRALRDLALVVSGGAPRVWHLPWDESCRRGGDLVLTRAPHEVRRCIAQIKALVSPPDGREKKGR